MHMQPLFAATPSFALTHSFICTIPTRAKHAKEARVYNAYVHEDNSGKVCRL